MTKAQSNSGKKSGAGVASEVAGEVVGELVKERDDPAVASSIKSPQTAVSGPLTEATELSAYAGDPNFMMSLARGLAVIRAFSKEKSHLTIAQISQKTGIPRAAVRRCLYSLAQLGYVKADETRFFTLQPKILTLGHAYLTSVPLATSAQPLLDDVSSAIYESCSLAVLEGDEILYVVRSTTSTRIMSMDLPTGSRLPAYCTSMGRVLLAHLRPVERDAYLSRVTLERHTKYTITDREKLIEALENVRETGYVIIDQELEIGLRSIAVPVKDASGKVVAAMNVLAQAARISVQEMEERVLPHLLKAADELSMQLLP